MKKSSTDKIKNVPNPFASRKNPLWTGPDGAGDNGGVTQGLLARFLTCRERTRLLLIEGIRPDERFNPRTEYGDMWHVCEEWHARDDNRLNSDGKQWPAALHTYVRHLASRYPFDRDQISHWH